MAAPIAPHRKKAATLRALALDLSIAALKGEGEYGNDTEFKKQLLLRIASNILPRLNEHTGDNGGAIVVATSPELANKYGLSAITQSSSGDSEE